jgi:hypothetical protein
VGGSAGAGGSGGAGGLGGRNDDWTLSNNSRAASGADGIDGITGAAGSAGSPGKAGADGQQGLAILNNGTVRTGLGRDTVDGSQGGFDGSGKYFMGLGADTVRGFGNAYFDGGLGRDSLYLPGQSTDYAITQIGSNWTFVKAGMTLTAISFESISYV